MLRWWVTVWEIAPGGHDVIRVAVLGPNVLRAWLSCCFIEGWKGEYVHRGGPVKWWRWEDGGRAHGRC